MHFFIYQILMNKDVYIFRPGNDMKFPPVMSSTLQVTLGLGSLLYCIQDSTGVVRARQLAVA